MERPDDNLHPVLLLPTALFRVYLLETLAGLSTEELSSFVALHLEEHSPFPLDQLYWGFVAQEDLVLAYAAYRPAVHNAGFTDLEQYHTVLPELAALLGRAFQTPSTILLDNGATRCVFSRGCLPQQVLCGALDQKSAEPSAQEQVTSFVPVEKGCFQTQLSRCCNGETEHLSFPSLLTRKSVWSADVRPDNVLLALQKQQQKEVFLRYAIRGLVGSTAACCLVSLLLVGAFQLVHHRQKRIARQAPAVERIKSDDLLADQLMAFSDKQMQPFAMLHIINELRPAQTLFKQVGCDRWNILLIEGTSPDGTEFNSFLRALNESPGIDKATVVKQRTTQGRTLFTLEVSFHTVPAYEVLDPAVKELGEEGRGDA